jgi:hypothetical protein
MRPATRPIAKQPATATATSSHVPGDRGAATTRARADTAAISIVVAVMLAGIVDLGSRSSAVQTSPSTSAGASFG